VRRTRQARDERRDDIRRALLHSIESLADEGFPLAEVTVERMAARAGISRAKFYVYFQDRSDVLRTWFQTITAELRSTTAAWWAIDGTSSFEDVRSALGAMVNAYHPHVTLINAVIDTGLYDAEIRAEHTAFRRQHIDDLAAHIRTGQGAGFIAPELPAAETAWWLALMAERMHRDIPKDASRKEIERYLDAWAEIVWRTLYI
jgi:AcrR family transcriptional regulator